MKRFSAHLPFDWTMSLLSAAFVGGLFLDGWAHRHGRVDATFFTPWHAVLYGAWACCLVTLAGTLLRNLLRGRPWRSALPAGYGLSLVGAAVWFVAGPADLLWHGLFGFEAVETDALLSPAHLLLALGLGLVVTGPLRAAGHRSDPGPVGWSTRFPMLVSVTAVFCVITFFMSLGHPLSSVPADAARLAAVRAEALPWIPLIQSFGVQGMLAWTALLMATVFFLLSRADVPAGAVTLVLGVNAAAMALLYPGARGPYPVAPVVGVTLAGVVADLLRAVLRPSVARPRAWRAFGFLMPVITMLGYFVALALTRGVWWSVHVWTGTVLLSGAIGWLMSYVVLAPRGRAFLSPDADRPATSRPSVAPSESAMGASGAIGLAGTRT